MSDKQNMVRLSALVAEQLKWENTVAILEESTKNAKKEMREISELILPELFAEMGLDSVTTDTGDKVSVKPMFFPKVTDENEFFRWLDEMGHGDIVKTEVSASFGKGEHLEAREAFERIADLGATLGQKVHPQTLKAFVRELSEKGKDLTDSLDLVVIKKTIIKRG